MQFRSLVKVVGAGIISFISSSLLATPADASFTVCNRAGSKAFVAVSYFSDGSSWSTGWLQLAPGSCGVAFPGRVSNANIGVHAQTLTGGGIAGDTRRGIIWVNVQPKWTIRNADDPARCKGKGRVMEGFKEIRTGESPDFTYEVYD